MPDISKINALAIGSVAKVDGLAKASILDIDGVAVPSAALLLDTTYGSGAHRAFSLRKLRSAYTGYAIQVRETGGDTTADIGFDSNGDLDQSAITAHCGSNDGRVTRIYDQTGDGTTYMEQTAQAQQMRICNAGTVETIGSPAKPYMVSDASSQWYSISVTGTTDMWMFGCSNYSASTTIRSQASSLSTSTTDGPVFQGWESGGSRIHGSIIEVGTSSWVNNTSVPSTTKQLDLDNYWSGQGIWVIGDMNNSSVVTMGKRGSSFWRTMPMQEVILYTSDKSTERTDIQDNLNDYYQVYS